MDLRRCQPHWRVCLLRLYRLLRLLIKKQARLQFLKPVEECSIRDRIPLIPAIMVLVKNTLKNIDGNLMSTTHQDERS